jgi:hypothetical protein
MYTISWTQNHITQKIYNANFVIASMVNLVVNNQLHTIEKWLVAYDKISSSVEWIKT